MTMRSVCARTRRTIWNDTEPDVADHCLSTDVKPVAVTRTVPERSVWSENSNWAARFVLTTCVECKDWRATSAPEITAPLESVTDPVTRTDCAAAEPGRRVLSASAEA